MATPYAYYNEFDPKAAAWLKQLIKNKLIMDGVVDDRSIIEVQPEDLVGFTRHHFFAGIAGWELALQLANWPIDRPVCTASLPCQPFSVAGIQKGKEDERHLLPHFIGLVKSSHFPTIFGEQVPGAIKHGWTDDLCLEMESENYTVGQIVLTAAGSGAPHVRQRVYWVANATVSQLSAGSEIGSILPRMPENREVFNNPDRRGEVCWSEPEWLYCRDEKYRPIKPSIEPLANGLSRGMGYSSDPSEPIDANNTQEARIMRLKAYGNAIVPQVAASFIKVFMEVKTL